MLCNFLKNMLQLPETKDLDIDSVEVSEIRKKIIIKKFFLRKLYAERYRQLIDSIPSVEGKVIEIGSGGGFLKDMYPQVITSDFVRISGLDLVLDACCLPFGDCEFKAILLSGVFHHIPDVKSFFNEAARCLTPGGAIIMMEPWVTSWSRLIYKYLHHEPFDPYAKDWTFPSNGPLSGANIALPWIVFKRDLDRFQELFPHFEIPDIYIDYAISDILSGGVSMRSLSPGFLYEFWRFMEKPFKNRFGIFALIIIKFKTCC